MPFKAVLFDFMGTTAIEKDKDLIHRCFKNAFLKNGIEASEEIIRMNRGRDKKEMILSVLQLYHKPEELLHSVLKSFNDSLINNLDNFKENDGAREIFGFLKEKKIIAGLGSGFPKDIFDLIFHHLAWESIGFDYIGIAEQVGKGRPHPDMILDMLEMFGLNKNELLKVGDTVSDIMEGKNAGVKTVAILSGTQTEQEIISQQPDFIIHHLLQLKEIIDC